MKAPEFEIAQCCGLWLAEGDNKTKSEITLTNNNPELIRKFHGVINNIFYLERTPRIYIYSRSGDAQNIIKNIRSKNCRDKRANKPYFIYRIGSERLIKEWKSIVEEVKAKQYLYPAILQGIFAGEGNIKFSKESASRILRIAQGKRNEFIEKILGHLKIRFSYSPGERSYVISGRKNLEILGGINISKLHDEKDRKFIEMLTSYKQYHYPNNYLKDNILRQLSRPTTTSELSIFFARSEARICQVLMLLKEQGKVFNFRVRSKDYWINAESNTIIISRRKSQILQLLRDGKTTKQVAEAVGTTWKSAFRRLRELEKLGLVDKGAYQWKRKAVQKRIHVIS